MADVQKENGYTSIANELLEAITRSKLTLRETKIILCVVRYTYGFQRKVGKFSARFLSEATGIKPNHIFTASRDLIKKNILINKSKTEKTTRIYSLNKDYDSWKLDKYQNGISPETVLLSSPETVLKSSPVKVTKKERKKTETKEDSYFFDSLPNKLNNNQDKEAWQRWIDYRAERKKGITLSTAKLQLGKLVEYQAKGMSAIDIINQSIEKGWLGLFPIKQDKPKEQITSSLRLLTKDEPAWL